MAIRLKALEKLSTRLESAQHVYKDLHLDIQQEAPYNTVLQQPVDKNDLRAWYDKDAIITSLRNLFTTKPGQRFLFPKYGLDLREFLFQPITTTTSRIIGEKITRAIRDYEPRVVLEKCLVTGRPDDNTYEIEIILALPVFNTISTINSVLDVKTQKFAFLS